MKHIILRVVAFYSSFYFHAISCTHKSAVSCTYKSDVLKRNTDATKAECDTLNDVGSIAGKSAKQGLDGVTLSSDSSSSREYKSANSTEHQLDSNSSIEYKSVNSNPLSSDSNNSKESKSVNSEVSKSKEAKAQLSESKEAKAQLSKSKEPKAQLSESKEAKAQSSASKEAKAQLSASKEVKAQLSKSKEAKAQLSKSKEAKAQSSESKEAKAQLSESKEAKAQLSASKEAKAQLSESKEAKAQLSASKEAKAQLSESKEAKAQLSESKETKAQLLASKEAKAQLSGSKEAKAQLSESKEAKAQLLASKEAKAQLLESKEAKAQLTESKESKAQSSESSKLKKKKLEIRETNTIESNRSKAKISANSTESKNLKNLTSKNIHLPSSASSDSTESKNSMKLPTKNTNLPLSDSTESKNSKILPSKNTNELTSNKVKSISSALKARDTKKKLESPETDKGKIKTPIERASKSLHSNLSESKERTSFFGKNDNSIANELNSNTCYSVPQLIENPLKGRRFNFNVNSEKPPRFLKNSKTDPPFRVNSIGVLSTKRNSSAVPKTLNPHSPEFVPSTNQLAKSKHLSSPHSSQTIQPANGASERIAYHQNALPYYRGELMPVHAARCEKIKPFTVEMETQSKMFQRETPGDNVPTLKRITEYEDYVILAYDVIYKKEFKHDADNSRLIHTIVLADSSGENIIYKAHPYIADVKNVEKYKNYEELETNKANMKDIETIRREFLNALNDKMLIGYNVGAVLSLLSIKMTNYKIRDVATLLKFFNVLNDKSEYHSWTISEIAKQFIPLELLDRDRSKTRHFLYPDKVKYLRKLYLRFRVDWENEIAYVKQLQDRYSKSDLTTLLRTFGPIYPGLHMDKLNCNINRADALPENLYSLYMRINNNVVTSVTIYNSKNNCVFKGFPRSGTNEVKIIRDDGKYEIVGPWRVIIQQAVLKLKGGRIMITGFDVLKQMKYLDPRKTLAGAKIYDDKILFEANGATELALKYLRVDYRETFLPGWKDMMRSQNVNHEEQLAKCEELIPIKVHAQIYLQIFKLYELDKNTKVSPVIWQ